MSPKRKVFQTDGSNQSGTATDKHTGLDHWRPLQDIVITDLIQASCGTRANDADWDVYANGHETDYFFTAEELDPSNQGRIKLAPDGIKIKAGTVLQFQWSGQGTAATNYLGILYQ